ncbi:MAG: dockerin type I repeat-containing protein [Oscillospiraceae bacterium]|nr:dockerin type I repeat-containing protein [Oscillospiraceae bacterium]
MLHQKIRKRMALFVSCLLFAGACLPAHADESLVLIRDDNNQIQLITESDPFSEYTKNNYAHYSAYYQKGEHGEILYTMHHRLTQVCYAVTDGSDIPEDFIHPSWWDEDSLFQMTVKEITPEQLAYDDITESYLAYSEECKDWFSKYPEGARLFSISYSFEYRHQWEALSKELSFRDGILDVFYRWEDSSGTAMWDGTDLFGYTREYSDSVNDNTSEISGLTEEETQQLKEHCEEYKAWLKSWKEWRETINTETMTPAEIEASRISAGIESEYDMTIKHIEFINQLSESHPGMIDTSFLSFAHTPFAPPTIRVENVWEQVGDSNGDGEISSADASKILKLSADKGAGSQNFLTGEVTASDINADGKADSADASLLLQYCAQIGIGENMTLQEFIKANQGG